MKKIDLNADLGEGIGNDSILFPYLSSCNIACGGHTGDTQTMNETVLLAKKHQVKIGAHPSYPDKDNFGRQSMSLTKPELVKTIQKQVDQLIGITTQHQVQLHHIKPHGALYNDIAKDAALAHTFLEAIAKYPNIILFVPYQSAIEKLSMESGQKIWREVFLDRKYHDDLKLVSRNHPKAVLHDKEAVLSQLWNIYNHQQVQTLEGKSIHIEADTYCIHGDNKEAIALVKQIVSALNQKGINIRSENRH